jgi:hypothetical protein
MEHGHQTRKRHPALYSSDTRILILVDGHVLNESWNGFAGTSAARRGPAAAGCA